MFFRASNSSDGFELWRTDGTPSGTLIVRDLGIDINVAVARCLQAVDEKLIFVAPDSKFPA